MALAAFCNQLVAFFEDLAETYPEEREISTAAQALKLMKQANPRLLHRTFIENVYTEFATHILEEDEDYILQRAKQIVPSHMNVAFVIFDKHWSTMTETNKQHVWRYMKTLVLLAKRV
jgi:hypothetical protein